MERKGHETMTTKTQIENGTAANLGDDKAAQEAVARAAELRSIEGGKPGAKEKAITLMHKVQDFGQQPVRVKHVAAAGAVAVAVVGYEYVAAKKDWYRLGLFDKKMSKK